MKENFKILEIFRDCPLFLLLKGSGRRGEIFGSVESEVLELECFE
jgi:hypothetical protein